MSTDSMTSELQSEKSTLRCEEEALVRAAQSGDIKSFSTLVERHQSLARAVAFSVCSDYSITEDLTQEAMVTAWLRLSDLSEPAKFRSWRRHQGRHAPRAQYGDSVLELLPDGTRSPLDLALHKEDRGNAQEALEALPSRYKEPLLLYYCLGESHSEVASALGVSEAAVRQRLCRARKKLKQGVTTLERSGTRLRTQTSTAAAVVLLIHSRQVWAHTAARVGNPAAVASPKLFMGLGALAGAALVACVAALVFIVTGNDSAAASNAATFAKSRAPQVVQPLEARSSEVQDSETSRAGDPTQPDALDSRGLVRIGTGRVKENGEESTQGPADARARPAPRTANASEKPALVASKEESLAEVKAGRIKKHGPARLDSDLHPEASKPLLRPTIDMKAVRRELWSD